ncbi:hypothetical protein SUGI_0235600 [Cryptomeria japonica]|nr:hypothetical protein SUGI_0235600 [Cryptomeria japonica]
MERPGLERLWCLEAHKTKSWMLWNILQKDSIHGFPGSVELCTFGKHFNVHNYAGDSDEANTFDSFQSLSHEQNLAN